MSAIKKLLTSSQVKSTIKSHHIHAGFVSSHPHIPKEAQVEFIAISLIAFLFEAEAIDKGNELYSDNLEGILDHPRMLNTSPAAAGRTLDKWVDNLSIMQLLIDGYQM
jgi:hypothetical protein